MNYLGNSFIFRYSFIQCKAAVVDTVGLLHKCCSKVESKKSQLLLAQQIGYLGFIISSTAMKISLATAKMQVISSQIQVLQTFLHLKLAIRNFMKTSRKVRNCIMSCQI